MLFENTPALAFQSPLIASPVRSTPILTDPDGPHNSFSLTGGIAATVGPTIVTLLLKISELGEVQIISTTPVAVLVKVVIGLALSTNATSLFGELHLPPVTVTLIDNGVRMQPKAGTKIGNGIQDVDSAFDVCPWEQGIHLP